MPRCVYGHSVGIGSHLLPHGYWELNQVIRLGGRSLYLLSHLDIKKKIFLYYLSWSDLLCYNGNI